MNRFAVSMLLVAMTTYPVGASKAESPAQHAGAVTVEVHGGERLIGVPRPSEFTVRLPYGELKVPWGCVKELRSLAPEEGVVLHLDGDDRFHGRITAPKIVSLLTQFGELSVPVERISRLRKATRQMAASCVEVPGAEHVDALYVAEDRPGEVLVFAQNFGAYCGGGTPATVLRLTFKGGPESPASIEEVQTLSKVQNVRGAVFRSSDGTLFTGGGWGGPRPPYYSTDGGKTWKSADGEGHPPNSTFSFCEFAGAVYAGTGYEPHHGQVYRWLGKGRWKMLLDVPPPRSIIPSMVAHDDRLFVATQIYWRNATRGGIPVYASTDGEDFQATKGIPDTHSVFKLMAVRGELLALSRSRGEKGPVNQLYRWNGEEWERWADYPLSANIGSITAVNDVMYACGKADGASSPYEVHVSHDLGKTWRAIAPLPAQARCIAACGGALYVGTHGGKDHKSHVVRIPIPR